MKTKKGRELSLVAITGDCAKGGLGDCNDALSFGPEHYGMVREFIKAQAEDEANIYLNDDPDKEEGRLIASRLHKAMMALWQANIFKHKWHCRTSWKICEIDCLCNHAPFKLDAN